MKFRELQALALRKLKVKILPPKLKNITSKATNPTQTQHKLYTMPSLRVGSLGYTKKFMALCLPPSGTKMVIVSLTPVHNL